MVGNLLRRCASGKSSVRRVTSLVLHEGKELFETPTAENFRQRFPVKADHQFKVATYNILAPCYALHPEVLEASFRLQALKNEIQRLDVDLLCLQEVERVIFEEDLEPWLHENGYDGIYFCKEPQVDEGFEEGIALMYKSSVFTRISSVCAPFNEFLEPIGRGMFFRHLKGLRDGFAMALLHHRPSGKEILTAGVDLYENQNWPDARVAQVHILCETLRSFLQRQCRPGDTSIVVLGDFGSYWKKWTTDAHDKWVEDRWIVSGIYSLLTKGVLSSTHCHHPYVRNHQGTIKSDSIKTMQFTTSQLMFESAYRRAHGREPHITKCTAWYKDVSDYVFYTPKTVETVSTLRLPYDADAGLLPVHVKLRPMPNVQFPSNHLPVGAVLALRQ